MTSTFARISLCMALISGTMIAGCSNLPNQASVSQPRTFRTAAIAPQYVDQIGAFNLALVENCPINPKWITQVGVFNLSDVDDVRGPITTNQIGAFNVVDDQGGH